MFEYILNLLNYGWVGILIGILTAIIFWKISKKEAIPMYRERSISLIGNENKILPSQIEIFYKKKLINKLSRTELVFWNNGKKTVDGKDIVKNFPITIIFDNNAEILSANIICTKKAANQFSIIMHPTHVNQAILSFDFLDYKDSATIEILHTGDAENKPELKGTIKGIPKGIKSAPSPSKILNLISLWTTILAAISGLIVTIELSFIHQSKFTPNIFALIGVLCSSIIGGFLTYKIGRDYKTSYRKEELDNRKKYITYIKEYETKF